MDKFREFLKRKNIVFSAKRYGIDALSAMAQGLFCSLLIGTIIKTLGSQLNIAFLTDIGSYAMAISGPAMAVAIGYALLVERTHALLLQRHERTIGEQVILQVLHIGHTREHGEHTLVGACIAESPGGDALPIWKDHPSCPSENARRPDRSH